MPDVGLWMMNTGFVAGDGQSVENGHGFKFNIRHSSALTEAMLKDEVVWTIDPEFGYEIVDIEAPENATLDEAVWIAILNPKRHYTANGLGDVYATWVARMKEERHAFLSEYDVDPQIITATVNR